MQNIQIIFKIIYVQSLRLKRAGNIRQQYKTLLQQKYYWSVRTPRKEITLASSILVLQ